MEEFITDIYLNLNPVGSVTLKNKILPDRIDFFDKNKVADEVGGYLVYRENNWHFIGLGQYVSISSGEKKILKKIALILESPNRDEYDDNYYPLRPANGTTGRKINQKLQTRINLIQLLCFMIDYEVLLVNPIQFQASCCHFLPSKIFNDGERAYIKEEVFNCLFKCDEVQQDFINRLDKYHPDIVFNCVTKNLKPTIKNAILSSRFDNHMALNYAEDYHPSNPCHWL